MSVSSLKIRWCAVSVVALRPLACRLTCVLALVFGASAQASTFDTLGQLTQAEFDGLIENLAAATHYKGVLPGETLGVLGADVGIELSTTDANTELFALAGGSATNIADTLVLSRIHAHKGLPFGWDVGAFVGALIDTDITVIGAELRYAIIEGNAISPALALRASASRIQGVTDIDLDTAAVEITLSKGLLPITPYVGAGLVISRGSALGVAGLEDVSTEQEKLFAGINVNLGVNFAAEVDVTGDFVTYTGKLGIRF